jgi:hypothetical protein
MPCYDCLMPPLRRHLLTLIVAFAAATPSFADENAAERTATNSVTAAELRDHVATLADDTFEGRLVGTRGGRAAAQFILKHVRPCSLKPAGDDGEFCTSDQGGRSILLAWPGSDPELSDEYIVVGAHYDHVGDGRKGHASGPIGKIYNGADDNASGVAALLEVIEALAEGGVQTRRSILFAFWDGEEMGMLGSNAWFKRPTVPSDAIRLAFNIDMVGRLRDDRLEVLGTRTGYGLRRLLAGPADDSLWLDFSWDMQANSDHWPFVQHNIPVVMLHTGLHDDYHRPGDDSEKINAAGLEKVSRFLLASVVEAANSDWLPNFRSTGRYESLAMQKRNAAATRRARQFPVPTDGSRPRLGIAWRTDDAEPASVYVTHVAAGSSAAAAGIRVDDRIYTINDQTFTDSKSFRDAITTLLDSGDVQFTLLVESRGRLRNVTIDWRPSTLAANEGTANEGT